jgi:hypothetical protein
MLSFRMRQAASPDTQKVQPSSTPVGFRPFSFRLYPKPRTCHVPLARYAEITIARRARLAQRPTASAAGPGAAQRPLATRREFQLRGSGAYRCHACIYAYLCAANVDGLGSARTPPRPGRQPEAALSFAT